MWPAFARAPRAMCGYQEGQSCPSLPMPVVAAVAPLVTRVERRMNAASDDAARADLKALPAHLDKIDAWIAEGVLGGEAANAADLQIAATLRLLLTSGDLQPLLEVRPAVSSHSDCSRITPVRYLPERCRRSGCRQLQPPEVVPASGDWTSVQFAQADFKFGLRTWFSVLNG